jgi:hypothetical protein
VPENLPTKRSSPGKEKVLLQMTCNPKEKCIIRQLKYTTLVWETLDELHPEIGATGHFDISSVSLSLSLFFLKQTLRCFPKYKLLMHAMWPNMAFKSQPIHPCL